MTQATKKKGLVWWLLVGGSALIGGITLGYIGMILLFLWLAFGHHLSR